MVDVVCVPMRSSLFNSWTVDSLKGVLGQEKALAADPSLGPGFWKISERAIKAVVGQDALLPWDTCR